MLHTRLSPLRGAKSRTDPCARPANELGTAVVIRTLRPTNSAAASTPPSAQGDAQGHATPSTRPTNAARPSTDATAYHLAGGGTWLAYYPEGFGRGDIARLVYKDRTGTRIFAAREIATQQEPGAGTAITVALKRIPGVAEITLSVLIPDLAPPHHGCDLPIAALAVTTVTRSRVITAGSITIHTVTAMKGHAIVGTRSGAEGTPPSPSDSERSRDNTHTEGPNQRVVHQITRAAHVNGHGSVDSSASVSTLTETETTVLNVA
jgi:hypothetical protein